MKKIIIVGAGENGYVAKNIISLNQDFTVVGFLDDKEKGEDILGKISDFEKFQKSGCAFFVAIGTNSVRRKVFESLKAQGTTFVNAIHPQSVIESDVQIGENVMIGCLALVNIRSVIGSNTFINSGCVVEHDNCIGSHSHLAPGVITGGGVTVGDETFVGMGAVIRDHKDVGHNVTVGMGAIVVSNIDTGLTVVGNPAKVR